ncbi:MAG: TonB-dependent receptor [Gemmatimonadetes bacterium]|nr:TonB-dependent receptor [Gemmatimonadota bacterium]
MVTTYELVETKSAGFYVHEQADFADRIFLSGSLRVDDHSSFGPDAPMQAYPGVSAAWVVSDENFWRVPRVDVLRVRGAWGRAGRAPGTTSELSLFVPAPGQSGSTGARPASLGNAEIGPEVTTELELGVDLALLDHRVAGQLTRYARKSEGLLLDVPVLSSSGFLGTMDRNLGRIDAWGWEAQLSAHLYESDLFAFDLDIGADFMDNEIVDMCEDVSGVNVCYAGTANIRIGYPFPNRTVEDVVVEAGFDATLPPCSTTLYTLGARCRWGSNAFGQGLYAYCDQGATTAPGGIADPNVGRYARLPGGAVGQCGDPAFVDQHLYAGRGFATRTFTLSPRVTFMDGALQVFALAEGQYGRVYDDSGHLWGHNWRNSAMSRVQDDPWWVAYDVAVQTRCAWDKCLYDADFWKLRELGARYRVPARLVARVGAERATVGLSARNVYTLWQAQKRIYGHVVSDPELGNPNQLTGGGNFYEQPPLSSVSFTLRVTF